MNFFKKLFYPSKKQSEWGIHNVEIYLDLDLFYERIKNTSEFDKRNIYYYRGNISNLKCIITNDYGNGERDINHISLEFVSVKNIEEVKKRVLFESSLFFPDKLKDIKTFNSGYNHIYHNEDSKLVPINSVLIAKEGVYFCSK